VDILGNEDYGPELGSDLLDAVAQGVCRRNMGSLAIFLLEAHKPLTGLVHTAAMISSPLLLPVFGQGFQRAVLQVFQSQKSVEELIIRIEKLSHQAREDAGV
jgi:hypothetical protein